MRRDGRGTIHRHRSRSLRSRLPVAGDWSHCQAAWAMLPAVLQEAIKNGTPAILTIAGRECRVVARLEELPGYMTHELANPMGNRLPDGTIHDSLEHAAEHKHTDVPGDLDEWAPSLSEIAAGTAEIRAGWSSYDLVVRAGKRRRRPDGSPAKMGSTTGPLRRENCE